MVANLVILGALSAWVCVVDFFKRGGVQMMGSGRRLALIIGAMLGSMSLPVMARGEVPPTMPVLTLGGGSASNLRAHRGAGISMAQQQRASAKKRNVKRNRAAHRG